MAYGTIFCLFAACVISQLTVSSCRSTPEDEAPHFSPLSSDTYAGHDKSSSSYIIGGDVSAPDSWPWQVFITNKNSTGFPKYCGGSIISDQWVLTAAHCVKDKTNHKVYGCKLLREPKDTDEEFGVAVPHVHPNYTGKVKLRNDIALLKLDRKIEFSDCMQAVRLPQNTVSQETICTATGWGRDDSNKSSSVLREVKIPVRDPTDCGRSFDNTVGICAGEEGKGTFSGDSGGPLVCPENKDYYEQGITSCGNGSCGGGPRRYVRVCCYLEWIKSVSKVTPYAHAQQVRGETTRSVGCHCDTSGVNGVSAAGVLVLIVLVADLISQYLP